MPNSTVCSHSSALKLDLQLQQLGQAAVLAPVPEATGHAQPGLDCPTDSSLAWLFWGCRCLLPILFYPDIKFNSFFSKYPNNYGSFLY